MPLEEYQRKRRFPETPEPPAEVPAEAGHRFVVQKHQASRLHYDFRLEMDGVLKSWAVPKGPSLDPADKRLAMMVEDHPVSYVHFEGIIPADNYGAGTVQVWDTGEWAPEGNPEEMLEKGDLKFTLNGQKLKGGFVLARMRSRRPGSKGTEWLLIKHRDEFVVPGYDIDKYDWSVLTRRSLAEIADDRKSAEWHSDHATKHPEAPSVEKAAAAVPKAKPRIRDSAAAKSSSSGKSKTSRPKSK
jgi:bifunctional non-homologous end joining protein LigD